MPKLVETKSQSASHQTDLWRYYLQHLFKPHLNVSEWMSLGALVLAIVMVMLTMQHQLLDKNIIASQAHSIQP